MKKVFSLIFCIVFVVLSLAVVSSAAIKSSNAVGDIVYVGYTDKAPNMKAGVIDSSWGNKIHINKNSHQSGMWAQYKGKGERWSPEDVECDIYFLFDDEKFYFAIYTPDKTKLGGTNGGDAVCFNFEADNPKLVYQCPIDKRFFPDEYIKNYRTFGAYVEWDDFSIYYPEGYVEDFSWTDTKDGYIVKWAITWKELGVSKKNLDEGCLWNFTFTRSSATDPKSDGGDGWLYWGKWFDISLAVGAESTSFYVADSPNATGPNTWIFSKKNQDTYMVTTYEEPGKRYESKTEESAQTATTEKPSSWAADEVNKAIAAGLVPTDLQKNYTKGISRQDLSKMLSVLLDKVYGKAPTSTSAKFSDTTDSSVLKAANLGIINGYKQSDGTYLFKPANTLKRSEMSAIINRVAKLCGKTTTGYDSEVKFTDTVNHWCKSELGYPVHMGIVKGTSATAFSPENTLTVEQTIMMIYRTYLAVK